jgi:acetyl esterase/lipase
VLIELHSAGCWTDCAQLGSQPIAYLGKIKVVAVDYHEPQFPTAVEEVTQVYRALLKSYRPRNIGIYGCSRGGVLVARSLAWFQAHALPRPAAAGLLCASAGGARGDAVYVGSELGNGVMSRGEMAADPDLGNVDPNGPLAAPVYTPDVLSKFPPTLLIAGARGVELSTAAYTHEQLDKLGVESDLHVFEGGRHSFWYDPAPPESKQVYAIIVRFFDRHLGR